MNKLTEEQSFTLSELIEYYTDKYFDGDETDGALRANDIVEYFNKKRDPEYQKYLELKKKFENS